MADPIAVFDSANPQGRADGDIVFMLELTDANGATVVVPVALEGKGDVPGVTVNIAKSAYTKESNGVPSNSWFAGQAKKNARYIKNEGWASQRRGLLPLYSPEQLFWEYHIHGNRP